MAEYLEIHPVNPQARRIARVVAVINQGGVVVYPTDSCYALGCRIGDKTAMERIRRIRNADRKHHFTLVCEDLSSIATYAKVFNRDYRLLKAMTPGPFTFILKATGEVPKRLQNPRRKTIGIRVPSHPVPRAILSDLGEPIMSSTLLLPGDELPVTQAVEVLDRLRNQVDLVVDGGHCGLEPTTVVDLAGDLPEILRQGKGDASSFISQ